MRCGASGSEYLAARDRRAALIEDLCARRTGDGIPDSRDSTYTFISQKEFGDRIDLAFVPTADLQTPFRKSSEVVVDLRRYFAEYFWPVRFACPKSRAPPPLF
jgi:hypothetical protein